MRLVYSAGFQLTILTFSAIMCCVQGRKEELISCPHCGREPKRLGRFCVFCGGKTTIHAQPELDLPRYRKRSKRIVSPVRCGVFHHELMVHVFRFDFCPECGARLASAPSNPQLSLE
jgi:hypothetical protein